jgi:hypothetical protein
LRAPEGRGADGVDARMDDDDDESVDGSVTLTW